MKKNCKKKKKIGVRKRGTNMAFPNSFHGSAVPGFGDGLFPIPGREPPFHLREMFDPGFDEHLHRLALMREAEIRARLELAHGLDGLSPTNLNFLDGMFPSRDRLLERELELREIRSIDSRNFDRNRDRRRQEFERGGSWSPDRDGNHPTVKRDRHRDRSPTHSRHEDSESDTRLSGSRSHEHLSDDEDDDRKSADRSWGREEDSRGHRDGRINDAWMDHQPSRTIILRNLPLEVDEKTIGDELTLFCLPVKDIRLIRKQSGVSRGFAFVEFHNVTDAQRWMEQTQGVLMLSNRYRVLMDYSITRERGGGRQDSLQRNDWVCSKCMTHNFKRRDFCYNCNMSRSESEKGRIYDGQDEIGTNPCNTLILRGLDALTTEETLVAAFNQTAARALPIKNIAVIRDELGTSRGFGFLEFHSVAASSQVLECLNRLVPPWEVDGKQLLVDYAKNTFNTSMAYIQQKFQTQQYDTVTRQYIDYAQLYGQASSSSAVASENTTNSAAAVAYAAIQQAQAAKHLQKQRQELQASLTHETVTVNGVEYPVYPTPDTSTYQYEETSGYYYDPMTHLYYDANSQYYYNAHTGQFMYWDAGKSTYLPAPDSVSEKKQEEAQNKNEGKEEKKEEKKEKGEKVNTAKKIAKDMARWAKSLNALKEAQKEVVKKAPTPSGTSRLESATADAGFAILQKIKDKDDLSLMPPPPKPGKPSSSSQPGLVASYGGDSDSGEEEEQPPAPVVDESKFVDWGKLACLLCKRQFQSKDILTKHIQVSQLHKHNLEALKSGSSS